jgi:hypothetical protein
VSFLTDFGSQRSLGYTPVADELGQAKRPSGEVVMSRSPQPSIPHRRQANHAPREEDTARASPTTAPQSKPRDWSPKGTINLTSMTTSATRAKDGSPSRAAVGLVLRLDGSGTSDMR